MKTRTLIIIGISLLGMGLVLTLFLSIYSLLTSIPLAIFGGILLVIGGLLKLKYPLLVSGTLTFGIALFYHMYVFFILDVHMP